MPPNMQCTFLEPRHLNWRNKPWSIPCTVVSYCNPTKKRKKNSVFYTFSGKRNHSEWSKKIWQKVGLLWYLKKFNELRGNNNDRWWREAREAMTVSNFSENHPLIFDHFRIDSELFIKFDEIIEKGQNNIKLEHLVRLEIFENSLTRWERLVGSGSIF